MNRLIPVMLVIVVGLLAGGCGSSRKSVVKNVPERVDNRPVSHHPSDDSDGSSGTSSVDRSLGAALVKSARQWIGTPYVYGGRSKSGTDCSGMIMVIYDEVAGLSLPRNSAAQRDYCVSVSRRQLEPGDLVFFTTSKRGGKVNHVGMYVGNGRIIHASSSRGVIESGLDEKYYATHYHSSGRVYGVTYAATGSKDSRKGKSKDKPKDKNKDKGREPERVLASEKPAPTPIRKESVPSVSLDDFIAANNAAAASAADTVSALTDTVIVVEEIVERTVEQLDSAAAAVDSLDLAAPSAEPTQPVTCPERTAPPSAEDKPHKQERRDTQQPDSTAVRRQEIRDGVARAMKFGK